MNMTKMNNVQKETLFSELYSLLTSGLSFSRSFELLTNSEHNSRIREMLRQLYHRVVGGATLWQSMQASQQFTILDYGVVRIGEETGKLDHSLRFLSRYYAKRTEQRRMITGAISYPLIILFTAVVVLIFMITVIVPMFEQVYARMGGELPGITRAIISFSRNFPFWLSVAGGILLFCMVIYLIYGKTERFRDLSAKLVLHIPLFGILIRKNYQAQFCKLLHLLYSSGVPLINGISMLEEIITFYPYRISFIEICNGLRRGELFANNLEKFVFLYDRKLVTLLRVAEETNCLDKILCRQAEELTLELEHKLKQLGHLLEPLLVLFVGGLVALILISMYLPMFKLGNTIS